MGLVFHNLHPPVDTGSHHTFFLFLGTPKTDLDEREGKDTVPVTTKNTRAFLIQLGLHPLDMVFSNSSAKEIRVCLSGAQLLTSTPERSATRVSCGHTHTHSYTCGNMHNAGKTHSLLTCGIFVLNGDSIRGQTQLSASPHRQFLAELEGPWPQKHTALYVYMYNKTLARGSSVVAKTRLPFGLKCP